MENRLSRQNNFCPGCGDKDGDGNGNAGKEREWFTKALTAFMKDIGESQKKGCNKR